VKYKAIHTIYTKAGIIDSGSVFTLKSSGMSKKEADELVERGAASAETEPEAKED
jgi:hypothetical protein